MKLSDAIAHAEGEIVRADYIDNTARMIAEKEYWRSQATRLRAIELRRAPEIAELV
jgi:hypothetical protein